MATKTVKQSENQAIILQSGLSLEDLTREMAPFMESVNQQMETEDPEIQEKCAMAARETVGAMMLSSAPENLAVRDRIAELYFALQNLAGRIRGAVKQAETMARRQERLAECIRGTIEAWMLTTWDSKKITGNYREFRLTKNPDKVQILDEAQIPAGFFDEVPATKVLNKTRLAEALKAGSAVPGAILETSRTRLDIR